MLSPSLPVHYKHFGTTTTKSAPCNSTTSFVVCFLSQFNRTLQSSLVPYYSLNTYLANLTPDDNPQINASRVAQRVMQGGHDVPIQKIVSRYYKSIANCSLLSKIVDRLYVYDNSTENELPELLFRVNEGKFVKQYAPMHEWAKLIYEGII